MRWLYVLAAATTLVTVDSRCTNCPAEDPTHLTTVHNTPADAAPSDSTKNEKTGSADIDDIIKFPDEVDMDTDTTTDQEAALETTTLEGTTEAKIAEDKFVIDAPTKSCGGNQKRDQQGNCRTSA
ncbi:hypothetical protein J6590_018374 [Homalodisca vitripennis]|nr:hypothetical protein J6590_018374 [Homalodisca vitripennis]